MKNINNIIKNFDKRMIDYIISFISGFVGIMLAISMVVWVLFERLGGEYFALITLMSLFVSSILSKKYSYLLDQHSRSNAVMWSNLLIIGALVLSVLIDYLTSWVWLYAVTFLIIQCYFSLFFNARSAVGQAVIKHRQNINQFVNQEDNNASSMTFKQLNATIEITDKLGAILSGLIVATLFPIIGISWMIGMGVLLLIMSSVLLKRFDEPKISISNQFDDNNQGNEKKEPKPSHETHGFAWFFQQPIVWIVILAMFVNLIVILSNTINSLYLYDVLNITPEKFAFTSIAFNVGGLSAGLLVNFMKSEKVVIYSNFVVGVLLALVFALYPTFIVFVIGMGVLSFANSANRVMFSSLIMHHIPNDKVASFYGIRTSLIQGIQFIVLFVINMMLFVDVNYTKLVVLFYPAVYLLLPVLWIWMKYLNTKEHDVTMQDVPTDRHHTLESQKTKHVKKYFVEHHNIY